MTAALKPKASGWTPARRRKHSLAMRRWKPWTRSTGPRTPAGKSVSSKNAFKHGNRAAPFSRYKTLLKDHSAFLSNLFATVKLVRKYRYYAVPGCAAALQKMMSAKGLAGHKKLGANELLDIAVRHRLIRFPARKRKDGLMDSSDMLRKLHLKRAFGWWPDRC